MALLRQQIALAKFGELALRSDSADEILTEACRLVGGALGTDLAKVMELQADGETLLVRAGVGWKDGVVGVIRLKVHDTTSEGHALKTGKPMISPDIDKEKRFIYPPFLIENGVKAVANVVILGGSGQAPYGILQIDSRSPRKFTQQDTSFLRSYANLIAAACDRLRLDGVMRQEEERVRLALHAGRLGGWDIDLATGTISTTGRTLEIFGHSGSSASWNLPALLEHVIPEDRSDVISAFRTAADTGADWKFECRIRRAFGGGARWIEAQGHITEVPGRDPAVRLIGLVSDITDRKRAEDTLHRVNRELEAQVLDRTRRLAEVNVMLLAAADNPQEVKATVRQTHRVDVVGELTSGLAHDYSNLLTSISGSLELIRTRSAQGRTGDLTRYIDIALAATGHAATLTRRLLAFSRWQILNPRRTDMNQVIVGMKTLLQTSTAKQIQIDVDLSSDLWRVFCDPNQLESALLNVVNSAREASGGSGSLRFRTTNAVLGDRHPLDRDTDLDRMVQPNSPPGDYVCLTISGTGVAVAPELLAEAFDPHFLRASGAVNERSSDVSRGFLKQSGGTLVLRTAPLGQAVVTIYWPRHLSGNSGAMASGKGGTVAPPGRIALLAEHEPAVRVVMSDTLSDAGYTVLEAGDGFAGLTIAGSADHIDLLITELNLLGSVSGQDIAHAARKRHPNLKILFLTSYAEGSNGRPALLEAGMETITKPFAMEPFTEQVRIDDGMIEPRSKMMSLRPDFHSTS